MNSTRSGLSRIDDAPQRRLRERIHAGGADEQPESDQVIHLDLRTVTDAEYLLAVHAVGRNAALAAEEFGEHQRAGEHQFDDAQRNHREGCTRFLGRHIAEQDTEEHAGQPADERDHRHRHPHLAGRRQVHRMDRKEGPQAGVHRIAEGQHPALLQQHVVRQAEDHHRADLRQ